jgi:hypothetical protein
MICQVHIAHIVIISARLWRMMMPREFYASWRVESPYIAPVHVHIRPYYCRDVAYHDMTRLLSTRFSIDVYDGYYSRYGWEYWVKMNSNTLYFTVSIFTADCELYIPRIIAILNDRFPSTCSTIMSYTDTFSKCVIPGIQICGDVSVIPAFYWGVLIMRHAHNIQHWEHIDMLFTGAIFEYDRHHVAWASVCNGDAPLAQHMLMLRSGPLSTAFDHVISDADMQHIIDLTANPNNVHHRWFHNDT